MVEDNPIDEARRYMDNAREILSKKPENGAKYSDPKYFKNQYLHSISLR